jgi:hypothetical protein
VGDSGGPVERCAEPTLALALVPASNHSTIASTTSCRCSSVRPTGREVVDGRSQVVGVRDGLLEPGGGLGSLAVPGELDRPAGVVLGSPLRRLRRPTGRLELVGREVADGLEQPEAGPSVERGRWLDEVALDQVHEDLDDRSLQLPLPDGGDRVEVPAPRSTDRRASRSRCSDERRS